MSQPNGYWRDVGIGFDQWVNSILRGSPDETLSSRAWRAERNGKVFGKFFRPIIDTLFFFEPNHCMHAYLAELERAQLPKNFN